jgi:hypothetical protein
MGEMTLKTLLSAAEFGAALSCIAATNGLAAPHNSHHNTGTGN